MLRLLVQAVEGRVETFQRVPTAFDMRVVRGEEADFRPAIAKDPAWGFLLSLR